ncbi:MAG: hypothetical protein EZS28_016081, partial [Streblomastix strix]
MEQFQERLREYQNFVNLPQPDALHYTNGLQMLLKVAQREMSKAIRKLEEMKRNREQRQRQSISNRIDPINPAENIAFREASNASKQFIRTVELIKSMEQRNISQQQLIPQPRLPTVPIQYNEVKNESIVRIDRYNILESTELQLWNLRLMNKLRQKILVIFLNERGSDAGGLSAEWCTEYFISATNPLNGIFRHHGQNNRLTVFGDDHGSGRCWKSPIQSQQSIQLQQVQQRNEELTDEDLKQNLPWWAAGVMLGKVLLIQRVSTSCRLDYSIWRELLGQPPCIEDLGEEEQEVIFNFRKMTAVPKYSEELKLSFEITVKEEGKDQTSEQLTFELKENGRNIDLSAENHVDFIELYSKRKIFG